MYEPVPLRYGLPPRPQVQDSTHWHSWKCLCTNFGERSGGGLVYAVVFILIAIFATGILFMFGTIAYKCNFSVNCQLYVLFTIALVAVVAELVLTVAYIHIQWVGIAFGILVGVGYVLLSHPALIDPVVNWLFSW